MIDFLFYFAILCVFIVLPLMTIKGIWWLFTGKKRRMFAQIEYCLYDYVSSSKLPEYDVVSGKFLTWVVWYVLRGQEFNAHTGKKSVWWVITCISINDAQRMANASDVNCEYHSYSDHIIKIRITPEEYEMLRNGEMGDEELLEKFNNRSSISSGNV